MWLNQLAYLHQSTTEWSVQTLFYPEKNKPHLCDTPIYLGRESLFAADTALLGHFLRAHPDFSLLLCSDRVSF